MSTIYISAQQSVCEKSLTCSHYPCPARDLATLVPYPNIVRRRFSSWTCSAPFSVFPVFVVYSPKQQIMTNRRVGLFYDPAGRWSSSKVEPQPCPLVRSKFRRMVRIGERAGDSNILHGCVPAAGDI